MAYLSDKETEFYEWLDQCPVPYVLAAEYPEFVSYNFTFEEPDDA